MGKKFPMFSVVVLILTGIVISDPLDAQEPAAERTSYKATQGRWRGPRYRLIEIGTLDGPNSNTTLSFFEGTGVQSLSHRGTFAGMAETLIPDPFNPNCFNSDCYVSHAIEWKDGFRTDLGALPGLADSSSASTWISGNGLIAGISENGQVDPFTSLPSVHGVLWKDGEIKDLGTLKGGFESAANGVNNWGEVVGFANNAIPDADSLVGLGSQTRAVIWRDGTIRDLGTLGGSDAVALFINEFGQIVGQSYTADSIPPPTPLCGDGPLTMHGFLWENGKMLDLKTLGGICTFAYALNNRGQVVGQSNLAGDQTSHPYLWENGRMKDLGTLGGNYGYADWLNDAGEVVGAATDHGELALLAFHWQRGVMSNLGTLEGDSCSAADAINSKGQTVGGSGFFDQFFPACTDVVEHAVVWEDGKIFDLNSLVTRHSDLTLNEATFINDRGEISGFGTLPNGDTHAFVLVPCTSKSDDCENDEADEHSGATRSILPSALRQKNIGHLNRLRRGIASGSQGRLTSTTDNLTVTALNTYQMNLSWQEGSGQSQRAFNIYRCHACTNPRSEGTKIASLSANVRVYIDGRVTSPLTENTIYTYQVTSFSVNGESAPSNSISSTTRTEPAPTNLSSMSFTRGGIDDVVRLGWTNNSTDDDSYFVESCTGSTCTNFTVIAQLAANVTSYVQGFQFAADPTLRYRVRAHSPGGFSSYSNIRNQTLP